MATTPGGLPYPVPTDYLAAGADAIKALALALDPYARPTTASSVASTTMTAIEATVTLVNLAAGTWDVEMKAGASWSTVGAPRYIIRLRQATLAGTELDQVQTYTTLTTGDVPVLLSKPKLVLAAATDILVTGQATGTSGGSTVLNNLVLKARRTA